MKKYITYLMVALFAITATSCYTSRYPHGHLPPGQAKKVYGGKSAKRYAPGQQKKKYKKHKNNRKHHRHDVVIFHGF